MRIRHRSLQRLSIWAEHQTITHPRVRFPTSYSATPLFPHGRCFTSSLFNRVTRSTQAVRKELTDVDSTIYALSTAPGRAAIAILRISGPACLEIYQSLCPDKSAPKPRYATVRTLYQPNKTASPDTILDSSALILYFPAPRTVTGEDVLELHVHGGPAVVQAVLKAISQCKTTKGRIRYAEAGEFTWRGFLNNRFDLTQVEALSEVLSASTEQQRKLSVRGTTGRLAKQYEQWRQQLLDARGELEALIDFQEDQHFDESPAVLAASVAKQVEKLKGAISMHITNAVRGELLRNGISIALLGAPNAGKSSLLNRIVGREAAIVSQEAGTTRDVVDVSIDINGFLCRLGDTAGLRGPRPTAITGNPIGMGSQIISSVVGLVEKEGIRRAKQRALESDVVLVLVPIELNAKTGQPHLSLDPEVKETAAACLAEGNRLLFIINKTDLIARNRDTTLRILTAELGAQVGHQIPIVAISCKPTTDQAGDESQIQTLLQTLTNVFQDMTSPAMPAQGTGADAAFTADPSLWQESLGASERHRLLLEDCMSQLESFINQVPTDVQSSQEADDEEDIDIVVAAESLRAAADCLARISGRGGAGDVEEVLGVVFAKFCVGK